MTKIFAANWKANPKKIQEAEQIAKTFRSLRSIQIAVFPPVIFLSVVSNILKKKKVSCGTQDISLFDEGSHTGEITTNMAKSLGVQFVLLGHSERRVLGEKNQDVAKKVSKVFEVEMIPLLCVGEDKKDRARGFLYAKKTVITMLRASLVGSKNLFKKEIVVAYEPVWAVGAKKSADVLDAEKMIDVIREELFRLGFKKVRVLYGGSVDEKNLKSFWLSSKIDGVLVGRASVSKPNIFKMLSVISSSYKNS